MIVDVRREAVDDGPVPVVHPGLAAADQANAEVEPLERRRRPPGVGDVLQRGAQSVTVLVVPETPEPDAVGLVVPVGAPSAGPVGIAGSVAVLDPGQRLVQGSGAHVEAEHRLDRGGRAPGHELIGAEAIGRLAAPGQFGAPGPVRADAIGPVVARGEVPAWPADVGHPEVTDGRKHVGAQPVGRRLRRPFVEHPAVDATAQVLGDAPEYPAVNQADRPVGQHIDPRHRPSFATKACYPADRD